MKPYSRTVLICYPDRLGYNQAEYMLITLAALDEYIEFRTQSETIMVLL